MIRDRSSKKWTSIMLPEHVKRLREWNHEMVKEDTPQQLTTWEQEEIQFKIEIAYNNNFLISLTIYHYEHWHVTTGLIQTIDLKQSCLFIETNQAIEKIVFSSIQRAEVYD